MMFIQIALVISVMLQLAAFIITISLIPKTRFNVAWISISIGFLLMALRRIFELVYYVSNSVTDTISSINSWIAIIISIAMLISSIYIRKIFEVLNRIHELRKDNEAKLLSAIISTEEKERKFFAKEIHDGLGPVLSSAKMTLSAIDRSKANGFNVELIGKTEKLVDNAINTTKEISNRLTPYILERYGLKKSIDSYVRNITDYHSIDIDINSNLEKRRFHPNLEVIIYRVSCELINNTLKYASASRVTILLVEEKRFLVYKYDDNGIGFDIKNVESNGMGLTNIRSRVKSLNGTIEMHSKPQKGFYVCIKIPL